MQAGVGLLQDRVRTSLQTGLRDVDCNSGLKESSNNSPRAEWDSSALSFGLMMGCHPSTQNPNP